MAERLDAPAKRVRWRQYHRLISTAFPPIDLFEDIADPQDWAHLCSAESKTNPRVAATIGNLDLVPLERRVGGEGATWVMASFTHVSTDRAGRFHDGNFGAFYAGNSFETALFETVHHSARFYAATSEEPGWLADMRELIGSIDARLTDIRGKGYETLLESNDYLASQAFAREQKNLGRNGIVYPSVRFPEGQCFAAFYPDVMSVPVQGQHLNYHWDGKRINMIRVVSDGNKVYELA